MYTKTQERAKKIDCGFVCLKDVYIGEKVKLMKFRSERTKTYENAIFIDFSICRNQIDEIDRSKIAVEAE